MSIMILNLLVFVLALVICISLSLAFSGGKNAVGERLVHAPSLPVKTEASRIGGVFRRAAAWQAEGTTQKPSQIHLNRMLVYAGFRSAIAAGAFQFIRIAMMIGFALIGLAMGAMLQKSLVGAAAVGCLLGYAIPTFVLQRMARARQRRILRELPDLLALMVVALEAGISIGEVIRLVGLETERQGRVMGRELSATAAHLEAGRDLEDSLKDLAERTGVDEVKSLTALVIQSEKVGASLAPALRASADLLNSRRRLAAEEAAHKTAVKMLFPLVFLILPAMMLIVLGPAALQIMKMFGWAK